MICPKVLKLINSENLNLWAVFIRIPETGNVPRDWLESILPFQKKAKPHIYNYFRLISLMNHVQKVFLKIIHNRIYKKCEAKLSIDQFSFQDWSVTTEALFTVQRLLQKCHYRWKHILYASFMLRKHLRGSTKENYMYVSNH